MPQAELERKQCAPTGGEQASEVYRSAALGLVAAKVPFLVGGAFALAHHTPIARDTKDFDIFVRSTDMSRAMEVLAAVGFRAELPFPHWLGKAYCGDTFIDLIFSSGNGVALVDDEWFANAPVAEVLGMRLPVCPAEEMIWSKAFVLERERYDGADVLHLLRDCSGRLDWDRLLRRFGDHWRVLLAHLVLFGFVYPNERHMVPVKVLGLLSRRLARESVERDATGADKAVCQGTLLSREQYLVDIEQLGYRDGRLADPHVHMTEEDVAHWTSAISGSEPHAESEPRRSR